MFASSVNESETANILNRKFNERDPFEVVVSDLTYVKVGRNWNYICTLLDLYNRKIIGYSCGKHKNADLVLSAFSSVKGSLNKIQLFHTDRGKEFINHTLGKLLDTFDINRSLSHKGTPYDNAVAEATFKSIKFEFIYPNTFKTLTDLHDQFSAYVWWFNNQRLHSALGYIPPNQFETIENQKYTL